MIATAAALLLMTFAAKSEAADSFGFLKFTTTDGETYGVETENLEITVQGENLTFSNTNLLLPIADLATMEFVETYESGTTAVELIPEAVEGAVAVYSLDGNALGSFASFSDALKSLGQGVYIVVDSEGNTLKIAVGQ